MMAMIVDVVCGGARVVVIAVIVVVAVAVAVVSATVAALAVTLRRIAMPTSAMKATPFYRSRPGVGLLS